MTDYIAILIGGIIGGVASLVASLLVQWWWFKREDVKEMKNKIYGPMLMGMNRIIEDVRLFKNPNNDAEFLKKVKDEWLFSTIGQSLKNSFNDVMDRFDKYQKVRAAAMAKLNEVGKQEVMDATNGVDVGAHNVSLNLRIGRQTASAIDLSAAIFRKVSPQEFIEKEKERCGENSWVEANYAGRSLTLEQYKSLYVSLLAKMENESFYLEEKRLRMELIDELESFQEEIKRFVMPKHALFGHS